MPCLDRPTRGTPTGAIRRNASDRRRGGNEIAGKALGCHRGKGIRPPSRPAVLKGAPSDAIAGNASDRQSRPAGRHAPPAWCRPTSACSPTPLRVERDRADCGSCIRKTAVPIYWCGAADAPGVGRKPKTLFPSMKVLDLNPKARLPCDRATRQRRTTDRSHSPAHYINRSASSYCHATTISIEHSCLWLIP